MYLSWWKEMPYSISYCDSTQKAIHYKLTLNGQSYDLYDYDFDLDNSADIIDEIPIGNCTNIALIKHDNYIITKIFLKSIKKTRITSFAYVEIIKISFYSFIIHSTK